MTAIAKKNGKSEKPKTEVENLLEMLSGEMEITDMDFRKFEALATEARRSVVGDENKLVDVMNVTNRLRQLLYHLKKLQVVANKT